MVQKLNLCCLFLDLCVETCLIFCKNPPLLWSTQWARGGSGAKAPPLAARPNLCKNLIPANLLTLVPVACSSGRTFRCTACGPPLHRGKARLRNKRAPMITSGTWIPDSIYKCRRRQKPEPEAKICLVHVSWAIMPDSWYRATHSRKTQHFCATLTQT